MSPKRQRKHLTQQDLKQLGVQPGLLTTRYTPDGRRARVEQLTKETRGARQRSAKLPMRAAEGG